MNGEQPDLGYCSGQLDCHLIVEPVKLAALHCNNDFHHQDRNPRTIPEILIDYLDAGSVDGNGIGAI
ncbi:hypothetical protein [Mycobacterium sp. 1274761.0]|uniref:hypothetical protein n=1 Tax=Mycobacterium sp. 1274761.0 TaxID=1834077 RepID=UPI0012E85C98|nr:hypothetical protein [Mycobacterium sp. 1274761.0]